MSLGKNIRDRRLENGWSQTELGLMIGATQEAISQQEADKKYLSLPKVTALSYVFNCTIDELVKDKKTSTPNEQT